ncbi:hypothetical protein, partial [Pseudomonas syringae]|uniref:hypothetical protein n=1 Tax=Pseudomonas syringae TaxID=317 RepID=UPI001CA54966
APALDASLRKSDAIRAELAKATTLDTQPRRRVKGYVSRGQGHLGFADPLSWVFLRPLYVGL